MRGCIWHNHLNILRVTGHWLNVSAPDSSPQMHRRSIDELLMLVEVFNGFSREVLIAVLAERGLDDLVRLGALPHAKLVALAVHTHRPGWNALSRIRRYPEQLDGDGTGSQMVDLPIG